MPEYRLTLTGGEPFAHPQIVQIAAEAVAAGFEVGLCTNASMMSDDQIEELARLGRVYEQTPATVAQMLFDQA